MSETRATCFAVWLDSEGYEASLEVGKLYRVVPDEEAAEHPAYRSRTTIRSFARL